VIVVTIEPGGDSDTVPTATHYLAGDLTNRSASLSVGAMPALGDDFSSAAGQYILATPTDSVDTNEASGVWFLALVGGEPQAGLALPMLPAGWAYEGWAVIAGHPVSTGRFLSAMGFDDAAPFGGPKSGPPFPGEDFLHEAPDGLTFPTDLSEQQIVLTIEPEPDDSPGPFALKPLVGMVPAGAVDHANYALENRSSGFPTGMATALQR